MKTNRRHPSALQECAWLLFLLAQTAQAATWYVATNGNDAAAGTNWAAAKRTIQAAVDVAASNDTVLVSNGVYATGTRPTPGFLTSNRVVITNNILVQSVNGPAVTSIVGAQLGNSLASVRCVFMSGGTLAGFAMTNGYAPYVSAFSDFEFSGGGAFLTGGTLSNCTLSGNLAWGDGGGSWGGTLNHCTLSGNSVSQGSGGGAFGGTLNHCALLGNTAPFGYGGGSRGGALNHCRLDGNSAGGGGGSMEGILNSCTLTGNSSDWVGGGAVDCTLNNCVVSGNSAGSTGGGSWGGTLNNCTVAGNSAGGAGGSAFGTLRNCIVYFNTDPNHLSAMIENSCTTPDPGAGNITNNPQCVDAANSNFHLLATSPCMDAGNNAYAQGDTDLDGNPRIMYGAVDLGAYEVQSPFGSLTLMGAFTWGSPALFFNRYTDATGITLIAEGSFALTNNATWNGIATNINGSWGGATNVSEAGTNNPVAVTIRDTEALATNRFLRLRVIRP